METTKRIPNNKITELELGWLKLRPTINIFIILTKTLNAIISLPFVEISKELSSGQFPFSKHNNCNISLQQLLASVNQAISNRRIIYENTTNGLVHISSQSECNRLSDRKFIVMWQVTNAIDFFLFCC